LTKKTESDIIKSSKEKRRSKMRAYDARYGWGTVVEDNNYHVVIQFDHEPEYTREYIKIRGGDEELRYKG
jgi:viroplasmin and RNaseH domain-containing protein